MESALPNANRGGGEATGGRTACYLNPRVVVPGLFNGRHLMTGALVQSRCSPFLVSLIPWAPGRGFFLHLPLHSSQFSAGMSGKELKGHQIGQGSQACLSFAGFLFHMPCSPGRAPQLGMAPMNIAATGCARAAETCQMSMGSLRASTDRELPLFPITHFHRKRVRVQARHSGVKPSVLAWRKMDGSFEVPAFYTPRFEERQVSP